MFKCTQCGKCCQEINIPVCYSDIERWKKKERYDILFQVSWINNFPKKNTGGFYIRDTCKKSKYGDKLPCPFLVNNNDSTTSCSIHSTKPKACKDAPSGFTEFTICPAWKEPEPESVREGIKNVQYVDFRRAFDERDYLLTVLFNTRKVST
jgi:Fe-S-cluster containining protein